MNESNKFTPGPWEHKKDGDGEWRVRQKGSVKKVLGGTTERPVCEVVNTIADARLIAAAPDLLEALENLLWHAEVLEEFIESERGRGRNADQLYADGEMHNYMVEAKASILKARGQQ